MINLKGLDKGSVLAALYNNSQVQGLGYSQAEPGEMTPEEGADLLKEQTYFDYLKGKVMKVDLKGDELKPFLYDRDNGTGAAQAAIDTLNTKE